MKTQLEATLKQYVFLALQHSWKQLHWLSVCGSPNYTPSAVCKSAFHPFSLSSRVPLLAAIRACQEEEALWQCLSCNILPECLYQLHARSATISIASYSKWCSLRGTYAWKWDILVMRVSLNVDIMNLNMPSESLELSCYFRLWKCVFRFKQKGKLAKPFTLTLKKICKKDNDWEYSKPP